MSFDIFCLLVVMATQQEIDEKQLPLFGTRMMWIHQTKEDEIDKNEAKEKLNRIFSLWGDSGKSGAYDDALLDRGANFY
jgi:hypothetical protein